MKTRPRSIAVLFQHHDRPSGVSGYIVDHLARLWRADGHEVTYLFGTGGFVPADIVLVHVDLSVVPASYLEFASRYPLVLNGRIRDIRKSVVSSNLVGPGDAWSGPVIAKSDLNCGGWTEDVLEAGWLRRHVRGSHRARRVYERRIPSSGVPKLAGLSSLRQRFGGAEFPARPERPRRREVPSRTRRRPAPRARFTSSSATARAARDSPPAIRSSRRVRASPRSPSSRIPRSRHVDTGSAWTTASSIMWCTRVGWS